MDFATTARLPEKKIDISVIVPVYNAREYLKYCIDSLLKQAGVDCEFILVDDCSTDDSKDILTGYASRDERIQIISLAANHGQAYARNIGLNKARGEFVYFMDSDDYLLKDDALMEAAQKLRMVHTDCLIFDAKNVFESEELRERYDNWTILTEEAGEGEYEGMDFFEEITNNDVSLMTVWRELWNRQFLVDSGLSFREETSPHEDLIFWFESMLCARIYYWKNVLYAYRVRNNSSSMKKYDKKRLLAHFYCFYYAKKAIEKNLVDIRYYATVTEWFARLFREIYENRISVIKEGEDINDISGGNFHEKLEYRHLILNCYPYIGKLLTPDEYSMLLKTKTILIYGAGAMGQNIHCMLNEFGIHNYIIVVTKRDEGMDPSIREAKEYSEFKDSAVVIIGVTKKYRKEVMDQIENIGFTNVISLY